MSESFELMNQRARDFDPVQLPRVALSSGPNPANHYLPRVGAPDEVFAAGMWRIIRDRKWTIAAFALVVVGIVAAYGTAVQSGRTSGGSVSQRQRQWRAGVQRG